MNVWRGHRFPQHVERALNPFRRLDLDRVRAELARLRPPAAPPRSGAP